jgi:hypothetical protein
MADLMYRCEQKKRFIVNGTNEWRWVERDVAGLTSGTHDNIRCMHCHGRVRVHVQQVKEGPADHVEHLHRQDSEHCRGGAYFKGEHRESQMPVR